MNEDELAAVLEDAGLSPYQADAYVTLLGLGAAPATEIANASGVPDPRIYDVLRDLEESGFVETYEQDSLRARARDPGEVLSDLRAQAEQYETAAEEIEERWNAPEMGQSSVSIVSRFETASDRASEYIRAAENQVHLSATVEQFERFRPALERAIENDVVVKLSINTDDPDGVDVDPAGAATEMRIRPMPAPFLVTVDRERVAFVPHTDSTNRYGVIVDDRSHAYVFHMFFLTSLWDSWEVRYSDRNEEPPLAYVDIRSCVMDVAPLLAEGAAVEVLVEGVETGSLEPRVVEGTLVDVAMSGDPDGDAPTLADLAGITAITVDAGDRRVEVGGWGAMIEDVEAERITITDVRYP